MTIPTQMSLHGFIATAPELNFTGKGHARFHCRVGVEHFRKEVDGSFTKLDPTFHDLVMFDRSAERAYSRFKVGDQVVASGYVHEYEQERPGSASEIREQFVARRVGHDCARTRYVVDRAPDRQPEAPSMDLSVVKEPTQAVGL
jgi:single-strand DNA-binding protein